MIDEATPIGHHSGATGTPSEMDPPDEVAKLLEEDMPAEPDVPPAQAFFGGVPGLITAEFEPGQRDQLLSGPDLFLERGFRIADRAADLPPRPPGEELAGQVLAELDPEEHSRPGARIPGDVWPLERPPDRASESEVLRPLDPDISMRSR